MKDILKANAKIICENEYTISENGLVAFSAMVVSSESATVRLTADGANATVLNCEGKNYIGEKFVKSVKIEKNRTKKFWITATSRGECRLYLKDESGETIAEKTVFIRSDGKRVDDPFKDGETMNRLLWLNSDKAIDHKVTKPFERVFVCGDEIAITGRKITLKNGFPSRIKSCFNESVKMTDVYTDILSRPVSFKVGEEKFRYKRPEKNIFDDLVEERNEGESENFKIYTVTKVEFDGFIEVKNVVECLNDTKISDVTLEIPFSGEKTKYFTGLGKKSGYFDGKLDWKWDENKNQDGFWCGNTDGGLKVKLKGENYRKPLVNIYYNRRKLNKPESWDNDGKGGIKYENGVFKAYAGERMAKRGDKFTFDVEFIVTPLKEIDLRKQFSIRIFHKMYDSERWIEQAEKGGANVINVHHGNDLNPYINYPFAEIDALKKFAEKAHKSGIGVKPYYTIRELSVYSPEFAAFRDFDYEIIAKNERNDETHFWQKEAAEWVEKNIGEDVICAWRQPLKGIKYKDKFDASVITEGQSRLCNFYVEGLDYLVKKGDVDGIYIDDVAYDRNTMKRVRKVLDKKENAIVDFHQWNHALAADGNTATMYMELYPYVDKCWIGEGFDYDETPDYYLTEVSGIPYGVMSEMMDAGNKYRGLLYGMTCRLGWETNPESPTEIWKLFDRFDFGNSEMVGWWDRRNSVKTGNPRVFATEYIARKKRFIAIANFSDKEEKVALKVENKEIKEFYAPQIKDFQDENTYGNAFILKGGKGLFLEIKEN